MSFFVVIQRQQSAIHSTIFKKKKSFLHIYWEVYQYTEFGINFDSNGLCEYTRIKRSLHVYQLIFFFHGYFFSLPLIFYCKFDP
jgi:hypothetical protein